MVIGAKRPCPAHIPHLMKTTVGMRYLAAGLCPNSAASVAMLGRPSCVHTRVSSSESSGRPVWS